MLTAPGASDSTVYTSQGSAPGSCTHTLSCTGPVGWCSPLLREPLPIEEAERLAAMFKALADPIRLRLLSVIASHESGEACVCELPASGFSVTGPTISHHLKVLREAGLIEGTRRGTWIYYRALPDAFPLMWRHIGVLEPK